MLIRPATPADRPQILAIYNQAVADPFCTADTEPATLASRGPWFDLHDNPRYPIFVIADQEVAGWCSLGPWRPGRKALEGTAEVSYYIERGYRGQGLGGRLLAHALDQARGLGYHHLLAVLLERNRGSLRLLEKFGFVRWGYLPDIADFGTESCGQFIYGRRL